MDKPIVVEDHRHLSDLSTLGIGGLAKYYIEVHSIPQMQTALRYADLNKLPYIVLGKGSNCLFDDRGFNGLVIHNKISNLVNDPPNTFYVGAGFSFSRLGALTARKGWAGLEFASGIPGSVGGAVYMNAGANQGETSDRLVSVEFVSPDGTIKIFQHSDLAFAYRTSPFQKMPGAIVAATFVLSPQQDAREKQLNIVKYRQETQPYSDKSAGCIFRNPPQRSAGALIDQSGLKGLNVGGAAVSTLHANFIVNQSNASAQDVLQLVELVQKKVLDKTGITLETEVLHIPYDGAGQGSLHE